MSILTWWKKSAKKSMVISLEGILIDDIKHERPKLGVLKGCDFGLKFEIVKEEEGFEDRVLGEKMKAEWWRREGGMKVKRAEVGR